MRRIYRYTAGGRCFHSKKAMGEAVRAVLNSQPMMVPFESDLMADLIAGYHYYCSKHDLRPVRFRKWTNRLAGYTLQGEFADIGWHGVSYRKCLDPPTFKTASIKALRRVVEPMTLGAKKNTCEKCGGRDRLEVDHVTPKFKEIAEAAFKAADDKDRESWDNFDWLREEEFQLPMFGPMVKTAVEMHKVAELQTLCAPCHRNVKRRPAPKPLPKIECTHKPGGMICMECLRAFGKLLEAS